MSDKDVHCSQNCLTSTCVNIEKSILQKDKLKTVWLNLEATFRYERDLENPIQESSSHKTYLEDHGCRIKFWNRIFDLYPVSV